MDILNLAQEIIHGKRLTREDDLSFFLTCDLEPLCQGADEIRKACVGDKVDLCSNHQRSQRPLSGGLQILRAVRALSHGMRRLRLSP